MLVCGRNPPLTVEPSRVVLGKSDHVMPIVERLVDAPSPNYLADVSTGWTGPWVRWLVRGRVPPVGHDRREANWAPSNLHPAFGSVGRVVGLAKDSVRQVVRSVPPPGDVDPKSGSGWWAEVDLKSLIS